MFSVPRTHWRRDLWPARWSVRRRHDALILLALLLCGSLVITALTVVPLSSTRQGSGIATLPGSTLVSTAQVTPVILAPRMTFAHPAQMQLYSFGPSDPGLMQPAVDAQGHLWVGEMQANRLARLDGSTGQVNTWNPPEGKHGLMTTALDSAGMVWFVEQNANYLGRFDPTTQRFQTFPLGTSHQHQMGPQSIQFDTTDHLWFTAAGSGDIGQLDTRTGRIRTWPVPAPVSGTPSSPFSLTVTRTGQVWFGYLIGGTVGHLDPTTGHVTLFHLGNAQTTIFAMTTDRNERIWFTELLPGRLGMIDPVTNQITLFSVPSIQNVPPSLYWIAAAPDGTIWLADNAASALVQYHPDQAIYTFFALPGASAPYGLTLDAAGRIWFTSEASAGELRPS
jgi:virginiamycin B lyase